MAFLSGSFFPLDGAPGWLRTLSEVLPLKHMNQAMLDVMVRGKGPASVLPELGILPGSPSWCRCWPSACSGGTTSRCGRLFAGRPRPRGTGR